MCLLRRDHSGRKRDGMQIGNCETTVLVRNLEPKQGRIREEHDLWNEKWIIAHVRRTFED